MRSGLLCGLAAVDPSGSTWTDRMPTATMFNRPIVNVIGTIVSALVNPLAQLEVRLT